MSSSPSKSLTFKGFEVRRTKNELTCLSDMHKAHGSPSQKRPDKWARRRSVQELLKAIAHRSPNKATYYRDGVVKTIGNVLEIVKGGLLGTQGTFGNSEIAIEYAGFLSEECHNWAVSKLVSEPESESDMDFGLSRDMVFALLQSSDPFPIDFDDAVAWWNCRTKQDEPIRRDNLLVKLKSNFDEGVDYHLLKNQEVVKRPQGGGSPMDKIFLTLDCFKSFGMMVSGERGKQIRRYFLNCEKELNRRLQQEKQERSLEDLEQEHKLKTEAHGFRVTSRNGLKIDTSTWVGIALQWARDNSTPFGVRGICEMHDEMNKGIQSLTSKQIKQINKLTTKALIRDYFDTIPLDIYRIVTIIAANLVLREGMEPREAVRKACKLGVPPGYSPKPIPLVENVRVEGRKLRERERELQAMKQQKSLAGGVQLRLWGNEGQAS